MLYTDAESKNSVVKVPKLTGLSVFEANKTASSVGLNIKVAGADISDSSVISSAQSIAPETEVTPGTTITVTFIHQDGIT